MIHKYEFDIHTEQAGSMISLAAKKHRIFKKVISIFLIIAFCSSFILRDAVALIDLNSNGASSKDTFIDVDTFGIPAHLGEIKNSFKGSSDKFVIHLQDAHCNMYAQRKMAGIIDYLNKEYGVQMINLEGGSGDYDLSIFTSISGDTIRSEVAEHFAETGEINGAELYSINNPDKVVLWGVEDTDLYVKILRYTGSR